MKGVKKASLSHSVSFPSGNVELLSDVKSNYEK